MACPYQQYYINQAGNGIGAIYRGAPYQRGHGIGSFLGGIFRSILPLFKTGARVVGKEALRTGANILGDLVENKSAKEVLQNRLQEAGKNLKRKANSKLEQMMTGSGYKKIKRMQNIYFQLKPSEKRSVAGRRKQTSRIKHLDIFN